MSDASSKNRQDMTIFGNGLSQVFKDKSKRWEYEFFQNFESKNTRDCYRRDIKQFLEFISHAFMRIKSVDQLERAHIVAFRHWLSQNKAFAPKTINRKMSAVSSYFDFLMEKDVLKFNPCDGVRRPRQEVQKPTQDLSDAQVENLLDVIHEEGTSPLHRAVIYVLFSTGVRKSELAHLKREDLRQQGDHWLIDITAKGGKFLSKVLHPHCVEVVFEYMDWMKEMDREIFENDYLFQPTRNPLDGELNRPLGPKSIDYILDRALKKAGISGRISPHSARATYIGSALEAGVDLLKVSRDVGHASVRTTQEYNKRRQRIEESPAYELGFFKKSS